MKSVGEADRRNAGRERRQGSGRQTVRAKRTWAAKMKAQLTLKTREVEQSLEGWGEAIRPRKSKQKSGAGESAALKSNKRYCNPD